MSREKQIEEMAKCCTYYHNGECCADATNISDCDLMCEMFGVFANLTANGYRKQSEGEWIPIIDEPTPLRECAILSGYECSECGRYEKEKQPYCNCGAKMKGESE